MINYTEHDHLSTNPQNDQLISAALLRVNRQIHTETSSLVYSANTFVLNSIQDFRTFVRHRSASQLAATTTLVFRIWRGERLLDSVYSFHQDDLTVFLQLKGLVRIVLANSGYAEDDPVWVLKGLKEMADVKILAVENAKMGLKYVRGKVLGEL
jgi:hypothetical protein